VAKVLYVEHDEDNVYMLKTPLELLGDFEVLAARDSESGCELAVTEHPGVILMDLEMPVVDRWEPVRRLRADPQTREIPIIGMSAHALESERELCDRLRRVRCHRSHSTPSSQPSGACLRTQVDDRTVVIRIGRCPVTAP
jgi:two-component system cell cycle response regulator DivK